MKAYPNIKLKQVFTGWDFTKGAEAAAQQIALGLPRAVEQNITLSEVQQMPDLGRVEALDRQEVLFPVRHDPWSQKAPEAVNMVGVSLLRRSQP